MELLNELYMIFLNLVKFLCIFCYILVFVCFLLQYFFALQALLECNNIYMLFFASGIQKFSCPLGDCKLMYSIDLSKLSWVESCRLPCGQEYDSSSGQVVHAPRNFRGNLLNGILAIFPIHVSLRW